MRTMDKRQKIKNILISIQDHRLSDDMIENAVYKILSLNHMNKQKLKDLRDEILNVMEIKRIDRDNLTVMSPDIILGILEALLSPEEPRADESDNTYAKKYCRCGNFKLLPCMYHGCLRMDCEHISKPAEPKRYEPQS
jgi:hypothetical protein